MALPGNGTILAVSKEREALYERAARTIVKLVENDLKPRDIATIEAFDNALALDVAMGGSTNTILHTLAIAREAGIAYDIKRIDEISRRVPCLCKVSPSSNYHVQDVHRAGGIHTILGELKRMGALNNDCMTVTGKTIGENIDEWDVRSGEMHTLGAKRCASPVAPRWCWTRTTSSGPAARTASGNLAPKPLLFFPADATGDHALAVCRRVQCRRCRHGCRFVQLPTVNCRWTKTPPGRDPLKSKPAWRRNSPSSRAWSEPSWGR